MLIQRSWFVAVCISASVLIAAGCSGPNAASVSGSVTLDGQPLTTGMVSFYPDGGNGAPASGSIDSSGNYSLSTGTDVGLAPGKYVAIVVATKEPPQPYDKTGSENPPIPITPGKYASTTTSDLHVEVKAGKNTVPLALQSPAKAGAS
jgi:hypothetical protein